MVAQKWHQCIIFLCFSNALAKLNVLAQISGGLGGTVSCFKIYKIKIKIWDDS